MFRSLDFIYAPTRNADEELSFCTKILGGEAVFSIRAFDTRVAAVRFGEGPLLLLAEHLEGERPILIFRVDDFHEAVKSMKDRGIKGEQLEIPHGPCYSFRTAGGQRLAIYELQRPEMNAHFAGRLDP
ncbi:MAG: VOC family protein [bacterium]